MWFTAAVMSALLFGLAGFFMKISQMRKGSNSHLLLGLYISGSMGFLINALWEGTLDWTSGSMWLSGIIIGTGSAFGNVIFMKALEVGPASLSSPLMNTNILIVVLLSTFVYGETFGLLEIAGVVLLLIGVALLSLRTKEPLSIKEKKWFFLVILAIVLFAIRNGGLKITAEMGLENTPILFISYFLSIFWFAFSARTSTIQEHTTSASRMTGLLWGIATGIFSYGGLQLYSLALQHWKANIVAPIFSTNGLVMVLGSIIFFKERLNRIQAAALFFLLIGLIVIRL